MSVATLPLGYRSYSQKKTLSYCSPVFDCKIRIYLFPNLSFAALFHVEYSSYDSLVWYTRVFYLVVLIEHIVDWNIQSRLSGERPIIHGVRLSVAYSKGCVRLGSTFLPVCKVIFFYNKPSCYDCALLTNTYVWLSFYYNLGWVGRLYHRVPQLHINSTKVQSVYTVEKTYKNFP